MTYRGRMNRTQADSSMPLSPAGTEREQTDESLRVEREKADRAYEDNLDALSEAADHVVTLARARADAVLAAARAKNDRLKDGEPLPDALKRSRAIEDSIL